MCPPGTALSFTKKPLFMPASVPPRYNLSFTAASLRPELARILSEVFLETGDWEVTKARVLASNALQARSPSSAMRLERELRQRLQCLMPEQLSLLAHSDSQDRAAMAWLAMLKYNAFVFDFASDLLRHKLATHEPVLHRSDYETFLAEKAIGHPELADLADTTRTKLRNVLLRMLTEVGMLAKGSGLGIVQRPSLSPRAKSAIRADRTDWLAGFLLTDTEIKRA